MEENVKELIIIGSGPAGLSASVYGARAMLHELVIEKESFSGGQIVKTDRVDNYLGLYGINGYDMAMKFREHADSLEVPFKEGLVTELRDKGDYKEVVLENGETLSAKAVIIATGAEYRKLGCEGEERLQGAGVSYCATCDGAFFRNKTVAVVGGGDVALEDALYLANLCEKVYLIHRRQELRGAKVLQQKVMATENITFMPYYEIKEICGESAVERIVVFQNQTKEEECLEVSGVFIAVGMVPKGDFAKDVVAFDDYGYIKADETCRTNVKGIYAIGDIRTTPLRQIITAVSDGAVAITSIEKDWNA